MLADSVGLALLVVLDMLNPAERLAFVLHDMFAMLFAEVAAVLGRSPEATRKLASRARRRLRGAPSPDWSWDLARQREVATAFLAASRGGDFPPWSPCWIRTSRWPVTPRGLVRLPGAAPGCGHGGPGRDRGLGPVRAVPADPGGRLGRHRVPARRQARQVVPTFQVSADRRITAIEVIGDPGRLRQLRLARCRARPRPRGGAGQFPAGVRFGVGYGGGEGRVEQGGCRDAGCLGGRRVMVHPGRQPAAVVQHVELAGQARGIGDAGLPGETGEQGPHPGAGMSAACSTRSPG